jgi:hypothetical protein
MHFHLNFSHSDQFPTWRDAPAEETSRAGHAAVVDFSE